MVTEAEKKEVKRLAQLRRRQEKRRFVYQYLLAHPCVGCYNEDTDVLDFHHIKGVKLFTISRACNASGKSILDIVKEIAKCEVRCANCHRKLHATPLENKFKELEDWEAQGGKKSWHGTKGGYSNHKCRCELCVEAQRISNREYYKKTRLSS